MRWLDQPPSNLWRKYQARGLLSDLDPQAAAATAADRAPAGTLRSVLRQNLLYDHAPLKLSRPNSERIVELAVVHIMNAKRQRILFNLFKNDRDEPHDLMNGLPSSWMPPSIVYASWFVGRRYDTMKCQPFLRAFSSNTTRPLPASSMTARPSSNQRNEPGSEVSSPGPNKSKNPAPASDKKIRRTNFFRRVIVLTRHGRKRSFVSFSCTAFCTALSKPPSDHSRSQPRFPTGTLPPVFIRLLVTL